MHSLLNTLADALSSLFGRLESLPHDDPGLTPENWCDQQPCMKLRMAGKALTISQPLSSFWVYFLGAFTIGVSLYFFNLHNGERSRLWWGVSLLLWGIGALLAGTSYQAFGYQIKCAGKRVCSWTSWWEVVYLMCQQVSMNAMLMAVAYSCTHGTLRTVLLGYAIVSSLVYVSLACLGGILPLKPLITFEFMLWASSPGFFFCCGFNAWRYYLFGEAIDLVLLGSWSILVVTMMAYWVYDKGGITEKLWAKQIWFSENDVLHLLLILWVAYILIFVADGVADYSTPSLSHNALWLSSFRR